MKEITIPQKLQPLVQAFFAESKDVAKALIIQSSRAIYSEDDEENEYSFLNKRHILTNDELQGVCALMEGLKPQDMLEALFAAQIVVSHMLGMRKLAKGSSEEQTLGLKMLRFSNEALCHLQKKRSGGMQNITVNYNYVKTGQSDIQNSIPQKEVEYAD